MNLVSNGILRSILAVACGALAAGHTCRAASRPEADRRTASLLLPGDVSPAGHERTERGGLVARRDRARLRDAGSALASEGRLERGRAAHRRPRLRLRAGLVARREADPLHVLPRRRAGAARARPADGNERGARLERRRQPRRALVARTDRGSPTSRRRFTADFTSSSSTCATAPRPASPSGSPRTATAISRATTTRSGTSISRRRGRRTAGSSSSSRTAARSGARAESGAWRRAPARR